MPVLVALIWLFVTKVSAAPQLNAPKQQTAPGDSLVDINGYRFNSDFFASVDTRDKRVDAQLAELDDLSKALATRKQVIMDNRKIIVADLKALEALRTAIDDVEAIPSHATIDDAGDAIPTRYEDNISDSPDITTDEHESLHDVNFYMYRVRIHGRVSGEKNFITNQLTHIDALNRGHDN